MTHAESVFIYPQPNDIFDVLYSSKRKLSDWELRKFALERGVVISEGIDRERLCLRIASIPFDHQMLEELNALLKTENRRTNTTSQRLEGKIVPKDIQAALEELKLKHPREKIDLNIKSNGKVTLKISYNKMDHSVTRLKQRKPIKAEISIEESADGNTSLRIPSSERLESIANSLMDILDDRQEQPHKRIDLNLSLLTPEQTNQFFLQLIGSIDGLPLSHTIKVGIQKSNIETDIELDEEDEDDLSSSMVAQINNATVNGHNPVQSPEIQVLIRNGEYHINSIRWETDRVNLQDKFSQEIDARIRLEVKGYPKKVIRRLDYDAVNMIRYSVESDRLYSTPEPLPPFQSRIYLTMLEDAAYRCFEQVRNDQCAINGSMQTGD